MLRMSAYGTRSSTWPRWLGVGESAMGDSLGLDPAQTAVRRQG